MRRGFVAFALAFASACGGEHATPQATSEATSQATPEPAAPAQPAGPRVERDGFALAVASQGPGYSVGRLGQLRVTLDARGGWHVNRDFPTSVAVTAPASLGVQKSAFAAGDAASFDDSHFVFDVPVTPTAAGNEELSAKVAFAVCKETLCVPQEETVALRVAVQ